MLPGFLLVLDQSDASMGLLVELIFFHFSEH